MTNFNSKEEAFKEVLSDLDFNLDTDAIWNSVEDKLPRKKDEPKLPFMIWGLSFLVVGMVSLLLFYPVNDEVDQITTTELSANDRIEYSLPGTKAMYAAIDKVAERMDNVQKAEISTVTQTNSNKDKTHQSKPTLITSTSIYENLANQNTSVRSERLSPTSKITAPTDYTKSSIQTSSSVRNMKRPLRQMAYLSKLYGTIESEKESPAIQMRILPVATAPIDVLSSKAQWLPYFSLSTGPSKNLSSFSNAENTFIDNYESDLWGLSTNMQYGMENGNWNVYAGLTHSYNASRFSNHDISSDSQDKPIETFHILGSGETESRAGFFTETTVTQNAIDWHRVHQNIDLQLGVGKTIFYNKATSLRIEAAASYNIWSKATGYYYSDNFTSITKFSTGQSNPYNKSNGLGVQLGLSIQQQIGAKTSLVVRPYYSKAFQPITNENILYQIRNSQMGLQIGVSYRPSRSH